MRLGYINAQATKCVSIQGSYRQKDSSQKSFSSEPRTVTSYQRSVMAVVREVLEEVGLTVETAASSSYSSSSPLHYVSSAIERCDGTVVLGIPSA